MTEERDALVCWPRDVPGATIVPGSLPTNCEQCGRDVWIAPSGRSLRDERNLVVICYPCAETSLRNEPGQRLIPPTPEQVAEAKAMVG